MKNKSALPLLALPLLTLCSSFTGCASSNLGREAQRSDGLLDFIGAAAGHPRRDVASVQRISGRGGEIATAHAEAVGGRKTRVSGVVQRGFSPGTAYNAHIDVKVLGAGGQLIAGRTTTYFPRPVPATYRGIVGRSFYSVQLAFVPPSDSTVQVAFHNAPLEECEFSRSITKP